MPKFNYTLLIIFGRYFTKEIYTCFHSIRTNDMLRNKIAVKMQLKNRFLINAHTENLTLNHLLFNKNRLINYKFNYSSFDVVELQNLTQRGLKIH